MVVTHGSDPFPKLANGSDPLASFGNKVYMFGYHQIEPVNKQCIYQLSEPSYKNFNLKNKLFPTKENEYIHLLYWRIAQFLITWTLESNWVGFNPGSTAVYLTLGKLSI